MKFCATKIFIYIISLVASILAVLPVDANAQSSDKILVLMNHDYPRAYTDEEGRAVGLWVDKVSAFLAPTGLPFDVSIVPWERLITMGNRDENVLIAPLDRTEDRDAIYSWLYKIETAQLSLIGRNTPENKALTKEDVLAGDGIPTCIQGSSHCKFLTDFGFSEDRLMVLHDDTGDVLAPLMLRGRADYRVDDFELFSAELIGLGIDPNAFYPMFPVTSVDIYLAASPLFRQDWLTVIQEMGAKESN